MDIGMHVSPYGVTIDEAPAYWQDDGLWVLLASGDQTAGHYSLLWYHCPQGSGPGPHTTDPDEQVYVLDGKLTFRVGNHLHIASAGWFLLIPRGTVHSFRVDSETATTLISYTPAGFERVITELGVPAKTRTLPPPGLPLAITDPRRMLTVFAHAGAHWVDEPDALRPAWDRGDPNQSRDPQGRPLPQ